jgi:cytochrome c
MRVARGLLLGCALGAVSMTVSAADDDAAALSDQEMKRGRILFLQCRACHSLTPDDTEGKIGPSLAGVFGRAAGSAAHFEGYSAALREAGHTWDSETMNRWLTGPSAMVPGTSMVFAGIADEGQRELLVRYLQVITAPTED